MEDSRESILTYVLELSTLYDMYHTRVHQIKSNSIHGEDSSEKCELKQGGAVRIFSTLIKDVPSKGDVPSGKALLVTIRYRVVFIKTIVNEVKIIIHCHQEEADTYICIHINMPAQLVTKCIDSKCRFLYCVDEMIDVALNKIALDQIFGEFGTRTNYIIFPLHNIAAKLGSQRALALLIYMHLVDVIRFPACHLTINHLEI